jgi:multiple sugar transport system permease protein
MQLKVRNIPIYIILIVLVFLWLLPVWTSFFLSTKTVEDYISSKFYQLPRKIVFIDNMKEVMKTYRLHEHFLNSVVYSASGAIIAILFSSIAGYSIVRLKPKFNFLLFLLIYSGTLFPFQMYLIPLYKLYNQLGLYNTKLGMILIYAALCTPFALFVYRGFYVTIPKEIEDAALIDGCGPIRSFFSIFLPQSAAPTAVVALFQMTWIWNDLLFGMILSRTKDVRPVMVALASMTGRGGGIITFIMTGVIFTSIPTIVLFVLLRKYFITGMTMQIAGD